MASGAGATILLGASAERYRFLVHAFSTKGLQGTQCVYAVTVRYQKPDGGVGQRLLFVGESTNLAQDLLNHPHMACLQKHKANCVLVHEDLNERSRRAKVNDLLNKYVTKCNQ
ncbi:MAG: hypothetical protein WD270_10030 [Acetobacterales bacterium]